MYWIITCQNMELYKMWMLKITRNNYDILDTMESDIVTLKAPDSVKLTFVVTEVQSDQNNMYGIHPDIKINNEALLRIGEPLKIKTNTQNVYHNSVILNTNLIMTDRTAQYFNQVTLNNKAQLSIVSSNKHCNLTLKQDSLTIEDFGNKLKILKLLDNKFGEATQYPDIIEGIVVNLNGMINEEGADI
ncbi:MAG: hypothetical protein EOP33_05385 [Rickettsiaceae bacterium]|nr:MAG: hypothetical protein EOP33_05385 [Rickettsiaceae bacterium]